MKLRSVADSLFTYLLQLKHDDKAIISRPKAVLIDLQLIEHDGHTLSAADPCGASA
jgi:hypothetical protein